MPFITIHHCPHYYEWITAASQQRTHRPVLVFIHGWGGSARYWEATARALSHSFDCLLYDLRGFARSQLPPHNSPDRYTLDTYAEDLVQLLKALQVEAATVMAHSMGTSIAVYFLQQSAIQIDRAILTCGGIFEYDERAFAAFYRFGQWVVKFRPRWLYQLPAMDRLLMQRFLHRPIGKHDRQAFLEDYLQASDAAAMGTLFDAVSQHAIDTLPQHFTDLSIPTLLVSGQCDRIIPPQLGRNAAALNPRIRHQVMPKVGHFPMLEDPEGYLTLVRSFLGLESGIQPTPVGDRG
ncbi:alpha/beta fold hydrolase [Alkalinema pantanalense CENA528]|uniref:alpha/beta fold hydrolase n=1 Tax=Alkalinema pantanalense TaxID=1620705 RepID=UPI003D6FBDE3